MSNNNQPKPQKPVPPQPSGNTWEKNSAQPVSFPPPPPPKKDK